jgi:hypothetical protein
MERNAMRDDAMPWPSRISLRFIRAICLNSQITYHFQSLFFGGFLAPQLFLFPESGGLRPSG